MFESTKEYNKLFLFFFYLIKVVLKLNKVKLEVLVGPSILISRMITVANHPCSKHVDCLLQMHRYLLLHPKSNFILVFSLSFFHTFFFLSWFLRNSSRSQTQNRQPRGAAPAREGQLVHILSRHCQLNSLET